MLSQAVPQQERALPSGAAPTRAAASQGQHQPPRLLQLQRLVGNRATASLITSDAPVPAASGSGAAVVQRSPIGIHEGTEESAAPNERDHVDSPESIKKGFRELKAEDVHSTLKEVVANNFMASQNPEYWKFSSDFLWWGLKMMWIRPKVEVRDRDANSLGLLGGVCKFDPGVFFDLETTYELSTYDKKSGTTYFHKSFVGQDGRNGWLKGHGSAPIVKSGLAGIKEAAEIAVRKLYRSYIENAAAEEASRQAGKP